MSSPGPLCVFPHLVGLLVAGAGAPPSSLPARPPSWVQVSNRRPAPTRRIAATSRSASSSSGASIASGKLIKNKWPIPVPPTPLTMSRPIAPSNVPYAPAKTSSVRSRPHGHLPTCWRELTESRKAADKFAWGKWIACDRNRFLWLAVTLAMGRWHASIVYRHAILNAVRTGGCLGLAIPTAMEAVFKNSFERCNAPRQP
jgi:hypothetical protein